MTASPKTEVGQAAEKLQRREQQVGGERLWPLDRRRSWAPGTIWGDLGRVPLSQSADAGSAVGRDKASL